MTRLCGTEIDHAIVFFYMCKEILLFAKQKGKTKNEDEFSCLIGQILQLNILNSIY